MFWNGTLTISNDVCSSQTQQWGQGITANRTTWPIFTCALLTINSFFMLASSVPSTLTIQAAGFTTSGGMPQLSVYGPDLSLVSTSLATSVSADGKSATFSFPTDANGAALPVGHYAFTLANQTPGGFSTFAESFFSLGTIGTGMTTPYGIDAADVTTSGQNCHFESFTGGVYCDPPWGPSTTQDFNVTLFSPGQVRTIGGGVVAVGAYPTSIVSYRTVTNTTHPDPFGGYQNTTQPSKAIVTNFGSNTVSILDLINNGVTNTISVGTQPVKVALNFDQTKAYVVNYGSSTLSEIDLSTNAQTRAATVGPQPAALAMDPSGSALWVGGLNYISKVNLTSLSPISTFQVSGQVTSVAVSAALNSIVYTVMSTNNRVFSAQQADITSGTLQGTYAQYTVPSSSYYLAQTTGSDGLGPPGWLMASGALVSAPYGNRYAVTGMPTGFAVIDLQTKSQMLQGSTPSAVRGIATDPANGTIFVTAPDSNSLITVPFPPQPN